MQYILTEEEYKDLIPKKELTNLRAFYLDSIELLNDKVLQLSNSYCIHTNPDEVSFCDNCPLNNFGTQTCFKSKTYSK